MILLGLLFAALMTGAELTELKHDGAHVVVEGRVIGLTESGFAMKVDDVPVTVVLGEERPICLTASSLTHPLVRVTGTLEQVLGVTASGQSEGVVGLRLLAPGTGDVAFCPDLLFFFNPFVLALVVLILLGYLLNAFRRRARAKTIMLERKRMADDLHDTIEQHLVGAGFLLQTGRTQEAREILVRAKKEMREIVWGLKNDEMMRMKPAEMIEKYAAAETQKGLCEVVTRLGYLPARLSARALRDLSLILREAVGNAVKHARAKTILIASSARSDGGWTLTVTNDGAIFDATRAPGPDEGHFGLEGMKERARRLGATFSIGAERGQTVVTLSFKAER